MSTVVAHEPVVAGIEPPAVRTLQDLLNDLGGVDVSRILLSPPPGLATEADVIEMEARHHRLCELVDGVLVEKTMGFGEATLALVIGRFLLEFIDAHDLGVATGADGFIHLFPDMIRIPDVAFVSWARLPGQEMPKVPVPELVPDLVVEVLSKGNTKEEMDRKRKDYLRAGVRLLWYVDPATRTASVFRADGSHLLLDQSQSLDGEDVLAGFSLSLPDLFARLDRRRTR